MRGARDWSGLGEVRRRYRKIEDFLFSLVTRYLELGGSEERSDGEGRGWWEVAGQWCGF